jgi:hypothetical protein
MQNVTFEGSCFIRLAENIKSTRRKIVSLLFQIVHIFSILEN